MEFREMHVLSASQFDREGLDHLFQLAHRMRKIARREVRCQVLDGYILGNYFFEESNRTRLSSAAAFMRLGGTVHTITEKRLSSMYKDESWEDAFRVLSTYCDLMVTRTPLAGLAEVASRNSRVPVINAGDGYGEHPTQALLDVFTIQEEVGEVADLTVGMIGDMRFGRTVHSLTKLLALYPEIGFVFVSPRSLRLPRDIMRDIEARGCHVRETDSIQEGLSDANVWYATRSQGERQDELGPEEKAEIADWMPRNIITRDFVERLEVRPLTILHPLPRNKELATDVDTLKQTAYFRQVENGLLIRMALLLLILDKEQKFV